jgi:3-oxoacyl-[acyl-carrier protein] reductase
MYSASDDHAAETERMVRANGGFVSGHKVDVTSEEQVSSFFKEIVDKTGRIDVLVNNAGVARDGLIVRMKQADWDRVMEVNLKGTFICTKLAAKFMLRQREGRVINVASVVGITGNPGQANYVASKAGMIGLTKSTARELAPRGITVNAVAPGYVETDMTGILPEDTKKAILNQIPLKRAGKPADVAGAVKFLASDDASYITGHVLNVSGGMYM